MSNEYIKFDGDVNEQDEEFEDEDDLEDEDQDESDDQINQVLNDTRDDEYGVGDLRDRFEQFKLYEILLSHQLFIPGSVDPRIANFVEREVKLFIASRMKVLMGREPERTQQRVSHIDVFNNEQLEALRSIADRLLQKNQQVVSKEPQIKQAKGSNVGHGENVAGASSIKQVAPVIGSQPNPTVTNKKKKRRVKVLQPVGWTPAPEDGNVGTDGTSYSQASVPLPNRIHNPSAEEINMVYAAEAQKNAQSFQGAIPGSSSSVLNTAITLSQRKNQNIKED